MLRGFARVIQNLFTRLSTGFVGNPVRLRKHAGWRGLSQVPFDIPGCYSWGKVGRQGRLAMSLRGPQCMPVDVILPMRVSSSGAGVLLRWRPDEVVAEHAASWIFAESGRT